MSILLLLLVPILIALAGLLFGKGRINWKEFLVHVGAIIAIISVSFFASAASRARDVEIWNGRIAEKDAQNVACCHSYACNCREVCSGSDESRSCSTECDICYEHAHDIRWYATTTNKETAFSDGCNPPNSSPPKRWNEIKIGEPTAIEHAYENYIKGNPDSLFRRTGTRQDFAIPPYPEVYDYYRAKRFLMVGVSDARIDSWNQKLDELNANLGAKKQVNATVIVVKESNLEWAESLNEKWLGGKKNDWIVVVGAPEYPKISWVSVLSWSKSEDAKIETRDRLMALGDFDADKALAVIAEEIDQKYVRREMKDFEYLKARIEPTETAQWIIWILGIAISIGLEIYFLKNDPFDYGDCE